MGFSGLRSAGRRPRVARGGTVGGINKVELEGPWRKIPLCLAFGETRFDPRQACQGGLGDGLQVEHEDDGVGFSQIFL